MTDWWTLWRCEERGGVKVCLDFFNTTTDVKVSPIQENKENYFNCRGVGARPTSTATTNRHRARPPLTNAAVSTRRPRWARTRTTCCWPTQRCWSRSVRTWRATSTSTTIHGPSATTARRPPSLWTTTFANCPSNRSLASSWWTTPINRQVIYLWNQLKLWAKQWVVWPFNIDLTRAICFQVDKGCISSIFESLAYEIPFNFKVTLHFRNNIGWKDSLDPSE